VRLGVVILPELRWSIAADVWRRAEALGFAHAWTYDHLAWRSLRDGPWFGAVPTLAAAAMVTTRMRLGPLVASPNFRHPLPFARESITLDDLSGGRLTLGLGAGGTGWDATILGRAPWTVRERAERFAEFVTLLDRLLREPEVSATGRYYSANEARTHPGCLQRPRIPFAIAATAPRGMLLAAQHAETWVTAGDPTAREPQGSADGAAVVRAQMAMLDEACARIGRDPSSLRRLVLSGPSLDGGLDSVAAFRETLARYADVGVTDFVVHWPRPSDPYAGDPVAFERIVSSAV
jgi:alkanesulfonate monooxygenase SsuD/methylene tetrahydromethanopterin reductase-like flavin-dependent oxidoreductase (luciferase family)